MDRTRVIALTIALIAAVAVPLCASSGWARGLGVLGLVGGGAAAVDYCTSSVCAGCLSQERFECGSTAGDDDSDQENAWTYYSAGANTNDNYTSTDLGGSESLQLTGLNHATGPSGGIAATDGNVYVAAKIKLDTFTASNSNTISLLVAGINKASFTILFGSGPIISDTQTYMDGVYDTNTTDISNPTALKYWKILYNNASASPGSDGVLKVWVSDDGTNWTLRHNTTNHGYTGQLSQYRIFSSAGNVIQFKDLRIDDNDINY